MAATDASPTCPSIVIATPRAATTLLALVAAVPLAFAQNTVPTAAGTAKPLAPECNVMVNTMNESDGYPTHSRSQT